MSGPSRRSFLQQAAAGGIAAAFAVSGTKASGRIIGANDRIRVGVAGIRGRGSGHINSLASMPDVDVTYLIDTDTRTFDSRLKQVQERGGNTPKCVQDVRQALDDQNLDAISIATCNHWHSLMTFWACQAKKDVYVEKPLSHNVFEGRQCVALARKNGCIVQHGTQNRGSDRWIRTAAAIASGKYGKLLVSKAYASKPRWSIGFKEIKDPPPELDFDIWLGPAPKQPYHENIVHYNWHWFWDFGNGEIGNQGVHQMDIARWGIPGATLPKSVVSMGGRWVNSTAGHPPHTDQGETPNMQITVFDFGETLMIFEVLGLCGKSVSGGQPFPAKVDNEFYLEEGKIIGGRFFPRGSDQGEALPSVETDKAPGDVFQNFIACMRSRNHELLHADVLEAHYSSALCHLGNISYRVGKQVSGNTAPAGFPDNPHVQDSLDALRANLKEAIGLDLSTATYQLGPKLEFDAAAERFVDNDEANALLTRPYRKPFEVPKVV